MMKNVSIINKILVDNLNAQLDKRGINQTDMARDLGFPETTVSNWMKGETYPRPDRLQMMADYFNVRRSDLTESKPTNIIEVSQETIQIPVLGTIACGDPILAKENIEEYRTTLKADVPSGDVFYLRAKGDSMAPLIPDGAMVLLRYQRDVETGEIAAVMLNGDEEATLKRVKKQGDVIMLVPENNKHDIIIASKENPINIIGKVVEIRIIV